MQKTHDVGARDRGGTAMKRRQLCGAAAGAPSAPRSEPPRGRGAAAAGRGRPRPRAVSQAATGGARGEPEGAQGAPSTAAEPAGSAARPTFAFPPALPRRLALLRASAAGTSAVLPAPPPLRLSRQPPPLPPPRAHGPSPGAGARTPWHSHPLSPPPPQSLLLHHFRTMKHPAPAGGGRGSGRRLCRSCRPPAAGPQAGLGWAGLRGAGAGAGGWFRAARGAPRYHQPGLQPRKFPRWAETRQAETGKKGGGGEETIWKRGFHFMPAQGLQL